MNLDEICIQKIGGVSEGGTKGCRSGMELVSVTIFENWKIPTLCRPNVTRNRTLLEKNDVFRKFSAVFQKFTHF